MIQQTTQQNNKNNNGNGTARIYYLAKRDNKTGKVVHYHKERYTFEEAQYELIGILRVCKGESWWIEHV